MSADDAPRADRISADALERLRPDLLAVARSIMLDDDEAQDVVQETMEVAIRRLGNLRSADSLLPWLLRIETRRAFRIGRRARRFVRIGWGRTPEPLEPDLPEASAEVRQALAKLPARTRAAVVLHFMAGLSVADTSAAMSVSQNTVKTQLKRGLERLRQELGDEH